MKLLLLLTVFMCWCYPCNVVNTNSTKQKAAAPTVPDITLFPTLCLSRILLIIILRASACLEHTDHQPAHGMKMEVMMSCADTCSQKRNKLGHSSLSNHKLLSFACRLNTLTDRHALYAGTLVSAHNELPPHTETYKPHSKTYTCVPTDTHTNCFVCIPLALTDRQTA